MGDRSKKKRNRENERAEGGATNGEDERARRVMIVSNPQEGPLQNISEWLGEEGAMTWRYMDDAIMKQLRWFAVLNGFTYLDLPSACVRDQILAAVVNAASAVHEAVEEQSHITQLTRRRTISTRLTRPENLKT